MIQAFLAFLPFIREVIFGRVDQGKKTKPRTVVRMIIYAVFVASLLLNYYTVKRSISLGIQVVKLKEQVKGNEIIREKLAVSLLLRYSPIFSMTKRILVILQKILEWAMT